MREGVGRLAAMKTRFPGYYGLTEAERSDLWREAEFVLDTNVLLNFYSWSEETRKKSFAILKKLESRLWMPHQVGLEYQRRRSGTIEDLSAAFESAKKTLG